MINSNLLPLDTHLVMDNGSLKPVVGGVSVHNGYALHIQHVGRGRVDLGMRGPFNFITDDGKYKCELSRADNSKLLCIRVEQADATDIRLR